MLAKKIKRIQDLLVIKTELTFRLSDKQAIGKQVQDFTCSFCLSYIFDPVMCSECENVFCRLCQETYYKRPENETCSYCRVQSKDRFKHLNKDKRKKLKQLTFLCSGCPSILRVNDHGTGVGEHTVDCV